MPPVDPAYVPDPREQEAYDEVARTRIPRPLVRLLVAGFLAALAVGPALEIGALARGESEVWKPLPSSARGGIAGLLETLRGSIAELELRFDERSDLVRRLRPRAQEALVRLVRYGNERAYVGRDGWLFFRPDFDHLIRRRPAGTFEGDPAREIVAFRDQLARRGAALVVLPAPVKPSIEPRRLAARAPEPPIGAAAAAPLVAALAAAGVDWHDPAPAIARPGADPDLPAAYLAADTHWRPETMDRVARRLAVELRGLVELPPGDPARFVEEPGTVEGLGDVAQLLGLPERATRRWRESVETRRVLGADGAPWRPTRGAPVLLLGDSFTAVYSQGDLGWGSGAGLAERLSFHLGLPVDRVVRNAGGASATREALAAELASDPSRLDGVRVVVWQLAARELTQGAWRPVELR